MKTKGERMKTRMEKWKDLRKKVDDMNIFYKNADPKLKMILRKAETKRAAR